MTPMNRHLVIAAAILACGSVAVFADTLVLRNGRSYTGELLSVRDGRVEFLVNRGRTERFSVDEVDRVEFRDQDRDRNRDDEDRGPSGNERPSGLREREVDVRGSMAWTRTDIELRGGQEVWFESRGQVRWGPGRKDGPEGESGSPRNAARPIPSRPGAALIGKIGESGDPFFIGKDSGPIRVRGRGTLFLGINDDYLQDNSGSFRVIVYY
ncbi:MAG: hypothetical protein JJE39_13435 [Vicinamibacteria bacterium]|nr:hypothetical protein [Vicinamibacteria bacterium]